MNYKYIIRLIGSGAVLLASSPVLSQNSPALEEVVVTAQKREQSLQSTPIAVSAFTPTALENKGVDDISKLANFTPNLVFDTTSPASGLSTGAAIFIRGIGNTDFSLTTDPGVGTYVDGIYISRAVGGVLDVLDVERIEVLRGPQGTLFGRNTIGGAINITSRKPSDELEGSLELTGGNFNRRDLRASVDLPISETVRSNFAFSSKKRDGYVDRVLVGDKLGDEDKLAFRGNFVYEPSDLIDFQLSYDKTKVDEQAAGSSVVAFNETNNGGATSAGLTGLAPGEVNQYITGPASDKTFGTAPSNTELEIDGVSFITNLHGDSWDLKYTTSYRDTEGSFRGDADNTPLTITDTDNNNYQHEQTSHELQLTGDLLEGRLKYVAGLYTFNEKGTDDVLVSVFAPFGPAQVNNFADVDNTSNAVYTQLDFGVTDELELTLGARYTEDEKNFDYTQYISAQGGGPTPVPAVAIDENGDEVTGLIPLLGNGSGSESIEFEETTFKFGANYTLPDDTLLYYSYSEGFKSGGFVLRYVQPQTEPLTFDPEKLSTHELGVKWEGWDNRLRLNAAIFTSDYEDVQVTFFDAGGGPANANAGTVEINGLELELTALLTEGLLVELGYGYTDAKYTSINEVPGLSLTIDESAKLVNTPENTFNLGTEYSYFLPGGDSVALRVDYIYTDDVYNDSQNSPFLFQEAYEQWNVGLRYSSSDEKWTVKAFVENATDERFITAGNSNFGLGFHEANYNRPREYGLNVKYNF